MTVGLKGGGVLLRLRQAPPAHLAEQLDPRALLVKE
jgi:hypothetical protein